MNHKKRPFLVLFGAGGHARSCIDVIEQSKLYRILGIIVNKRRASSKIFGYPTIGTDKTLKKLPNKNLNALVCVGQIKTPKIRMNLYKKAIKAGFKLPVILSPHSYVSPHTKIGAGTIIMNGAIINAGSVIGKNCIINSKALIEHDVIVGDHCHVSTAAVLNGGVILGNGSFVGSGAIIKEGVKIGNNCIVAANKYLFTNLKDNKIYKL